MGPFAILGLFGPFSLVSFSFFIFIFEFFSFFKYLMMSNILAIICVWKVTSKPLVWPPFEPNFAYMKWTYGIFKFFSIFFNFLRDFLLARVWQAVSFQPLDRIQFSNAHLMLNINNNPQTINKKKDTQFLNCIYRNVLNVIILNFFWGANIYLRGSLLPIHWQRFRLFDSTKIRCQLHWQKAFSMQCSNFFDKAVPLNFSILLFMFMNFLQ